MVLPLTSLIIASRNRPELLYGTVQSILKGNKVPDEIVILDQSDVPHPQLSDLEQGRGCAIRYHWSQSIGTSKARNLGLQLARHESLVIIDDDIFVDKDWLANLLEGLGGGNTKCVVTGRVLAAGISDDRFAPSIRTEEAPASYEGRVGKDVLWSNNMAMHRSVIEEVGFFDERMGPGTYFPAGEDNDYGFRLLEAGYRIFYLPSAVVYHRDWRLKNEYVGLRWKYGVGRGAYYAKYFNLHDRYQLVRMVGDIRKHLFSSFYKGRGDWMKAYGDLALAGGIFVGACSWLATYGRARP